MLICTSYDTLRCKTAFDAITQDFDTVAEAKH